MGVLSVLDENNEIITKRVGRGFAVTAVSARDKARDRGRDLSAYRWHDNPVDLASDPEVDLVIELIGGSDGPARELVEKSLAAGKPVITANKALVAHHGKALAELSERNNAPLAYEAAVAGGIPAIKTIREGMAANRITRVYGILNGTCNYILTTMRETGRDFDDVLKEAQDLGYAEADPTFDVDGIDAAHKLAILTSVAFNCQADFESVYIEGIRRVTAEDIAFAEELGYRIKLLGIASMRGNAVEQRVHPCMVPKSAQISTVEGVFNAVYAEGDAVDSILAVGRGAGAGPTASAVVADMIDVLRGNVPPLFGLPASELADLPTLSMDEHYGSYYVRLSVLDKPGVIAQVAAALRDAQISLEALLQRGRDPDEAVPVVMTTHECTEGQMRKALEHIAAMEHCVAEPQVIRIENS